MDSQCPWGTAQMNSIMEKLEYWVEVAGIMRVFTAKDFRVWPENDLVVWNADKWDKVEAPFARIPVQFASDSSSVI